MTLTEKNKEIKVYEERGKKRDRRREGRNVNDLRMREV